MAGRAVIRLGCVLGIFASSGASQPPEMPEGRSHRHSGQKKGCLPSHPAGHQAEKLFKLRQAHLLARIRKGTRRRGMHLDHNAVRPGGQSRLGYGGRDILAPKGMADIHDDREIGLLTDTRRPAQESSVLRV